MKLIIKKLCIAAGFLTSAALTMPPTVIPANATASIAANPLPAI